jgi:hypothetical protein
MVDKKTQYKIVTVTQKTVTIVAPGGRDKVTIKPKSEKEITYSDEPPEEYLKAMDIQ